MPLRIPDRADVVVVGAGTAGAVAARRAAASGARVLLVEKLPAQDVGRKICGNAITGDGVAAIQRRVSPPSGPEVAMRIESGRIVLPDGRTALSIPSSGLILNRLVFGQRLVRDALDAGVELIDECSCIGWADRAAVKVRVRQRDGTETEIAAKVLIDATGYRGVLTRAGGPSHADALSREQVGIGYRELAPVADPFEMPASATIVLSPEGARGGYGWVFPMGSRLANAGVGAPLLSAAQTIRDSFARFRERPDGPRFLPAIDGGTGMLPLRPPVASMVGDGFLSVGDAACQTNPLHGGGIASSIVGGAMAGEAAARVAGRRGASTGDLWSYGPAVMRELGATHAAHDILRRFLLTLSPGDLAFLGTTLSRAGAFTALTGPSPRVQLSETMRLLAGVSARPGLALSFVRAGRLMESARRLYEGYPESPEKLDPWRRRVQALTRAVNGLAGGMRP